jgi:hypothetical protein
MAAGLPRASRTQARGVHALTVTAAVDSARGRAEDRPAMRDAVER